MRALAVPNIDAVLVFQSCVNGIADVTLRYRLNALNNFISLASEDYQARGNLKQLYTLQPIDCENNAIAVGAVTKQELKDVYSTYMVGRTRPAREIYDWLLSLAPLGKCPFCGVGYASTLDHYLPKKKFPHLSVVPSNLVPSCKDCNTGKGTSIATTPEQQSLHPYFDHHNFINEQWLYAEVIETTPATIHFYALAPAHWDNISKERVQSHFRDFKLAARYSVEASNELACLRGILSHYWGSLGFQGVRNHLNIQAEVYFRNHPNSWQTAMFQALGRSDWYCNSGFE